MTSGQTNYDYTQIGRDGYLRRSRMHKSDFALEFDWAETLTSTHVPENGNRLGARDDMAVLLERVLAFAG